MKNRIRPSRKIAVRRIYVATAATVAMLLFFYTAQFGVSAAGGDLDPTFDGDGRVITDFGSNNDDLFAVAIQPDGKMFPRGTRQSAALLMTPTSL